MDFRGCLWSSPACWPRPPSGSHGGRWRSGCSPSGSGMSGPWGARIGVMDVLPTLNPFGDCMWAVCAACPPFRKAGKARGDRGLSRKLRFPQGLCPILDYLIFAGGIPCNPCSQLLLSIFLQPIQESLVAKKLPSCQLCLQVGH